MKRTITLSLLCILAVSSAVSARQTIDCNTVAHQAVALGEPFVLPFGGQTTLPAEDLTLTFVKLLEDSRCPAGVVCIRAGKARIAVEAQTSQTAPKLLDVGASPGRDDTSSIYASYKVNLLGLAPLPGPGENVPTTAYCATLKVTSVDGHAGTVETSSAASIEDMHVFQQGHGWASSSRNIFFTADNGQHWRTI